MGTGGIILLGIAIVIGCIELANAEMRYQTEKEAKERAVRTAMYYMEICGLGKKLRPPRIQMKGRVDLTQTDLRAGSRK